MSLTNYPDKYLLFNQKLSKNLGLVLEIEGVGMFGIADSFTTVRYGDQGLVYGLPGLVYGGRRRIGTIKPYIQLDAGLNIQQRIEPEQGRGNIAQITINLIDYKGEVSAVLAPGAKVPEIMGTLCRLWVGFTDTSFPHDYVLAYQGQITQVTCPPGKVSLQISDSTNKTRQPIFNVASSLLAIDVPATGAASGTLVTLSTTAPLHHQIIGPDGTYDPTVSTYLEIDSEIMEYAATGILNSTQVLVTRGVLGTQIDAHQSGTTVMSAVGFGFNITGINCIDFALKLLLSGFDGPEFTNVGILSFVYDYAGNYVPNEFLLETEDAVFDLGLAPGDYFSISGSASGNSVSGRITGILEGFNGTNNVIQTDQTFAIENPTNAVVSFRSQYDTFPTTCGVGCFMNEVDVPTFQAIQRSYFSAAGTSNLRSYYNAPVDAQSTISQDIMLPIACYAISRYGRISMAITKPPLPGSGKKLVQLDFTNVIDPDKIQVTRSTNQRSFYNEVKYSFDFDIAQGEFASVEYFLDTTSLQEFRYTIELPIEAKSVSSALGGAVLVQSRGQAILSRFSRCLTWIELTVNWSVGSLIEVSDIVNLVDNGNLKIMNFETGQRNIGTQLFEVIDRNYQILTGNVKLKLLGGLGFDLTSRFGLISPSSVLSAASTPSALRVTPSFGQTTIQGEMAKWIPLVGMPIQVHDPLYAVTGSSVILSTNPADPAGLLIDPPLPFAVSAGMILDIAQYPTNTVVSEQQVLKSLYTHVTPTIPCTGLSTTSINVLSSDVPKLTIGNWIEVRSPDFSIRSQQCFIQSIVGTTVTVEQPFESNGVSFTPGTGYFCEGIGFHDGKGAYLYG